MDSEFIVRLLFEVIFVEPIKAVVGFKSHFPKRGDSDEYIRKQSDSSVGKRGLKQFAFRPAHIENKIVMIAFAPVIF